jgi:hypothetical protein
MDKPTYLQTWSLITSLWNEWCPNDATARLCAERWSELHQDKLQDAAKLHKMEASGQYKEPKIHRIMEIYSSRTTQAWATSEPAKQEWSCDGPTPHELAEWDRWADDILADVSEEELKAAQEIAPVSGKRVLACAVDYIRKRRAGISVLPERSGAR